MIADLPGYEDRYTISDDGEVVNKQSGCIRKLGISGRGYKTIQLGGKTKYKQETIMIHKAVAKAFIPNPFNFPVVNHIDGNKLNNNVSNLEWCTQQHNIQHAYRTGLSKAARGEKNGSARLNAHLIREIRKQYDMGVKQVELKKRFGITSDGHIHQIVYGEIWKHV